jgi:hypothetical protein
MLSCRITDANRPVEPAFGSQPKETQCHRTTARAFGGHMDWADYLRDEAAKYRRLSETAEDLSIKQELLDLAAVCEEAANNIEDRMPGG